MNLSVEAMHEKLDVQPPLYSAVDLTPEAMGDPIVSSALSVEEQKINSAVEISG